MFKEVGTSGSTIDIKDSTGSAYEGYYLGSKDITTKIGPQTIYKFRGKDKRIFQVYGFTNLNRAMEMVSEEQFCRLTYLGMEKVQTKFGLKDVHQVKVEVDEEDVFERDINEETTKGPF